MTKIRIIKGVISNGVSLDQRESETKREIYNKKNPYFLRGNKELFYYRFLTTAVAPSSRQRPFEMTRTGCMSNFYITPLLPYHHAGANRTLLSSSHRGGALSHY